VVRENAGALSPVAVEDLPRTDQSLDVFATSLKGMDAAQPAEVHRRIAIWVLGAAIGLLLARSGWTVRSLPGEPVILTGRDGEVDPMAVVRSVAAGETRVEEWRERTGRLGIAGRHLAEVSGPRDAAGTSQ
jgi:hypothetical protein